MATTLAVGIIGAGASMALSSSSAKKQQKNLDKQMKEARRIRAENTAISNKGFDDIIALINGVGSISDYLTEGESIGKAQMDYRMKYALGDSEGDVRDAQGINARLAAYDFSDVDGAIGKILKSGFYDIASITRDMPTGSFANLSVANMASLAQQGLQNTIAAGDYIGRISGIDQYTPYRVAQDLFTIDRDKASQKIQATNNNVSQRIGVNTNWFSNFSDISNASNVVEASKTASMIQGISSITGAIGGYQSGKGTANVQAKQADYYNTLINRYSGGGMG